MQRAGAHKQPLRWSDVTSYIHRLQMSFLLKAGSMHGIKPCVPVTQGHTLAQVSLQRPQVVMSLPPLVSLAQFSYSSLLAVTGSYVVTRVRKPSAFLCCL